MAKQSPTDQRFRCNECKNYYSAPEHKVHYQCPTCGYICNKHVGDSITHHSVDMTSLSDTSNSTYLINMYSYTHELEHLREFISSLQRKYSYEQNNKLGNQKFYFDELPQALPINVDGTIRYEMARNELVFTMYPFHTNKSLQNVFGNHLDVVKQRVDLFCNKPEWYERKGIPHTLGIMMYGPPGTGKTALIKALAKDTKRHIFNIKLRKTQYSYLF